MSPSIHSLGIDQLTRDERLVLVQDIWDTIAGEPHPPLLNEAQRRALERRVADFDADPDDVVPWEQVKSQVIARLRKQ